MQRTPKNLLHCTPRYPLTLPRGGLGNGSLTASALLAAALVAQLTGCTTAIPGRAFPRKESVALTEPQATSLGAEFLGASRDHADQSAFRILTQGVDGFLTRVQLIEAAQRSVDLQYFIFRGDETGRLITEALEKAANRGVRVRVLVDDGATEAGDEQLLKLDGHPQIEVRVFNPLRYRGHLSALRTTEMLFGAPRLDYRMHNKLLVADNSVALVGGRNIGNQYFQMDVASQFADDDVFAAGPVAAQLSATFDEYWNSALAIPAQALGHHSRLRKATAGDDKLARHRQLLKPLAASGVDYAAQLATGEPLAGMLSGRLPLVWAQATVVCDSPQKKAVESGETPGRLMAEPVLEQARAVQRQLLIVNPYFIPVPEEMQLITQLPQRGVTVRMLTNSLMSAPELSAHSGYARFRLPLLKSGVELYEVRARPGEARGTGQTRRISRHGNFALHAKLLVFDDTRVFLGSMNLDQRSKHLNTEIGVIIESRELALQTADRITAMVRPANAYQVSLAPVAAGSTPAGDHLVWDTQEDGQPVHYTREPAHSNWQRFKVWLLALLPLDGEL